MPKIDYLKADPRLYGYAGDSQNTMYHIRGNDDVGVSFDIDNEYPWMPAPKQDGRFLSFIGYAYATSKDCVDAIEDGSWRD